MCPRYDYTCKTCAENFEAINTIGKRHTAPCPKCGGEGKQKITNPQHVRTIGIGYCKKDTGDFA